MYGDEKQIIGWVIESTNASSTYYLGKNGVKLFKIPTTSKNIFPSKRLAMNHIYKYKSAEYISCIPVYKEDTKNVPIEKKEIVKVNIETLEFRPRWRKRSNGNY